MIEETAVVMGRAGSKAQVRIERSEACEGCHACSSLAEAGRYLVTEVEDALGSTPGDIVKIRTNAPEPMKASLLLFGFPLVMLIAGYIAGSSLAPVLGWKSSDQAVGIVAAGIFFFGSFFLLSLGLKGSKTAGDGKSSVVEILGHENA